MTAARKPSVSGPSCGSSRYSAMRCDQPRRLHEGVVGDVGKRGVAAAPVHEQPERRRRLLGGGAGVEDAAAQLEPVAGSLVDGVLAANGVGMLLAEPAQPLVLALAHLLVGGRGEEQVAGRLESLHGRATRWRRRSPPPGPSCPGRRGPTRSRPAAPPTRDRPTTRTGRRAPCPCARAAAAAARRPTPECERRGSRGRGRGRRARTRHRSPRGTRGAARRPPSRSPEG